MNYCDVTATLALFNGAQQHDDVSEIMYAYICPPLVIGCLISVVLNFCLLIIGHFKIKNKSPILLLSLNLATTDTLSSLLVGFGFVFNSYLPKVYNIQFSPCKMLAFEICRTSALIASVSHLFALAFIHYRGIVKPLHYRGFTFFCTNHLTHGINCITFISWIVPLFTFTLYFSLIPCQGFLSPTCNYIFLASKRYRFFLLTTFLIPLVFMFLLYMRIFVIISKNQKRRFELTNHINQTSFSEPKHKKKSNKLETLSDNKLMSAKSNRLDKRSGRDLDDNLSNLNNSDYNKSSFDDSSNQTAKINLEQKLESGSFMNNLLQRSLSSKSYTIKHKPTTNQIHLDALANQQSELIQADLAKLNNSNDKHESTDEKLSGNDKITRLNQLNDKSINGSNRLNTACSNSLINKLNGNKLIASTGKESLSTDIKADNCVSGLRNDLDDSSLKKSNLNSQTKSNHLNLDYNCNYIEHDNQNDDLNNCKNKNHLNRNFFNKFKCDDCLDSNKSMNCKGWKKCNQTKSTNKTSSNNCQANKMNSHLEVSRANQNAQKTNGLIVNLNNNLLDEQKEANVCLDRLITDSSESNKKLDDKQLIDLSIDNNSDLSRSNKSNACTLDTMDSNRQEYRSSEKLDVVKKSSISSFRSDKSERSIKSTRLVELKDEQKDKLDNSVPKNPIKVNTSKSPFNYPKILKNKLNASIHGSRTIRFHTKALFTTLTILGTYLICWMPALIFLSLTCIDGCPYPLFSIPIKKRVIVSVITNSLVIIKAITDPFIYIYRIQEVKVAVKKCGFYRFLFINDKKLNTNSRSKQTAAAAAASANLVSINAKRTKSLLISSSKDPAIVNIGNGDSTKNKTLII